MSELVSFSVPLTLAQTEYLVASAYTQLPPLNGEPYYGFLDREEAARQAQAMADCYGAAFLWHESLETIHKHEPVFSFQNPDDVCAFPLGSDPCFSDSLTRYRGADFPFRQVSFLETEEAVRRAWTVREPLGEALADALDTAGFFRFDLIYPSATDWYDPTAIFAWERLYNGLARCCRLDDENASEQGFPYVWSCAQPLLVRLENAPVFRYAAWTNQDEDSYVVCLDEIEYTVFHRSELGEHNPRWIYWAFETERLVRVLDLALQARGIPERCYLEGGGNDSRMLFLTDEQTEILISSCYLER
ncbi:hypothetical protein [Armatimonas sp.]|uniref:hypothetical protein n=1 Tax=Armatimonas sp. TaxID=1872638 RepID=UPI00286A4FE1|nr:hypothetical protein [Armatimonas sp.]